MPVAVLGNEAHALFPDVGDSMSRNLLPFQKDLSHRWFQYACYDLGQFLLAAVVNACDSKDFPFTDIQIYIL